MFTLICALLVVAIPSYATAPAFLSFVATPLTFSIATGLSCGLLSFAFLGSE